MSESCKGGGTARAEELTQETDRHGDALTDESGEVGHARCDGVSASTFGDARARVEKVEDKLKKKTNR